MQKNYEEWNSLPAVHEINVKSSTELLIHLLYPNQSSLLFGLRKFNLYFRGEASDRYQLVPSALRSSSREKFRNLVGKAGLIISAEKHLEKPYMQIDAEYTLMRYFYREANQQGLSLPPIPYKWHDRLLHTTEFTNYNEEKEWIPTELAEIAALMQHYGIPTRLLDWTSNILVALYFAASGALNLSKDDPTENMVIWIMDYEDEHYFAPDAIKPSPIRFITPPYGNNSNLNAQQGVLSYIPLNRHEWFKRDGSLPPIEFDKFITQHYSDNTRRGPVLIKAKIPRGNAQDTLSVVSRLGVNASKLFPGYTGIVAGLKEKTEPF